MRINAVEHEQAVREGAEDFFGVFADGLDATGQGVKAHIMPFLDRIHRDLGITLPSAA